MNAFKDFAKVCVWVISYILSVLAIGAWIPGYARLSVWIMLCLTVAVVGEKIDRRRASQ